MKKQIPRCARNDIPRRNGFTLLELIAALALAGLCMLGGVLLLDQLTDSGARIVRDGIHIAREGNGDRMLRRLLIDATTSTDSTKRFRGDAHSVELWTLCDIPSGWAEACRVTLAIDVRRDSSVLLAESGRGESYELLRRAGPTELRYYNAMANPDSAWATRWSSNVTLPVAIGLLDRRDTIVLPVGAARE